LWYFLALGLVFTCFTRVAEIVLDRLMRASNAHAV